MCTGACLVSAAQNWGELGLRPKQLKPVRPVAPTGQTGLAQTVKNTLV